MGKAQTAAVGKWSTLAAPRQSKLLALGFTKEKTRKRNSVVLVEKVQDDSSTTSSEREPEPMPECVNCDENYDPPRW